MQKNDFFIFFPVKAFDVLWGQLSEFVAAKAITDTTMKWEKNGVSAEMSQIRYLISVSFSTFVRYTMRHQLFLIITS